MYLYENLHLAALETAKRFAPAVSNDCVFQLDGKKWTKHVYPNNIQIKNSSLAITPTP